ncbi:MAG: GNAT family N-acetyltransferase [Desulfovibrio sp.]|nr:GNAT family N-acetyltransferase [Desulfovibrio sp.]
MAALEDYTFRTGGAELLDAVAPLWRELCDHHAKVAPVFAPWFQCREFRDRAAEILAHAQGGLQVQLAQPAAACGTVPVGFCICSMAACGAGEVDSIYVQPAHRGAGIGEAFMHAGLTWLEGQGASPISLAVVSGNDRAMRWYARFGFTPRRVQLVRTHTA